MAHPFETILDMKQQREYLTAEEAGERLRVAPRTIRYWGVQGIIPVIRLSRKSVRYPSDLLDAWADQHLEEAR